MKIKSLKEQKGLTLIEVTVVLIILALLFAFLGKNLFSAGDKAKAQINQMKMQKAKNYIQQYQLQYNNLPPDLNSLSGCTEATGSGCIPIASEDDFKDAWDQPFAYSLENGGRSFVLKSLGADRKNGGEGVDGDPTLTGP